ncbi:hypothetical protein Cgig2_008706 [Carnegiea gigantea]|uniref:PB1-like domain-containing protein n=1 Tax=Carnegiea gigantea TaxID=171969 RepID=A0A9Q1JNW2_9CARY|nr:hypothetical protein Cgig2_008706 [Carnegiea gigantea]
MSAKIILHMHHGDCFQKIPNLVYGLGEMKKVECDTNYLSADNIKGIVIELEYNERKIKKIYYSLVSIKSDEEVCELIVLSKNFEYVSLSIEHNEEPQSVVSASNDNESNDGESDCMADDKYEEYRSKVEDEEVARIREEKKRMHDEVVADFDELRAESRENWGQRNAFDDIYACYQDSNDADSPISSESDDDDDGKKHNNIPYNAISSNNGLKLEVGLNVTMLKKTYAYTLKPVNGPNLWSPCEDQPIVTPIFKQKKKGNYPFKRRLEEGERRPQSKYRVVSRSGGTVKCSLRKEHGHNKKTCRQKRHESVTTTHSLVFVGLVTVTTKTQAFCRLYTEVV